MAVGCVGPVFALELFAPRLLRPAGPLVGAIAAALVAVVLGFAAYSLFVRRIERRPVTELAPDRAWPELAAGLAIGSGVLAAAIGVLAALGLYQVEGRRDWTVLVVPLLMSIGTGVIEEIVFRGIVFRLLEEASGTWGALVLSSALFGLLHLVNPQATLQGAVAIVFEAGVMLAAAYVLTRRLWLPIGIHVGWNFTQGGVFGVPVSGFRSRGWLDGTLSGPDWLSGGRFGAEASIVAVILGIALGTTLLVMAARRGRFIAPPWRRAPSP